jgi:hypothetical protein
MSDMWVVREEGEAVKNREKPKLKKLKHPKKIVVAVPFTFACLYYAETKSTKESSVWFKSSV